MNNGENTMTKEWYLVNPCAKLSKKANFATVLGRLHSVSNSKWLSESCDFEYSSEYKVGSFKSIAEAIRYLETPEDDNELKGKEHKK